MTNRRGFLRRCALLAAGLAALIRRKPAAVVVQHSTVTNVDPVAGAIGLRLGSHARRPKTGDTIHYILPDGSKSGVAAVVHSTAFVSDRFPVAWVQLSYGFENRSVSGTTEEQRRQRLFLAHLFVVGDTVVFNAVQS